MAAHHDHAIWGDDVEEFKPERFLHDKNPRPNGFLPFGGGIVPLLRQHPSSTSTSVG